MRPHRREDPVSRRTARRATRAASQRRSRRSRRPVPEGRARHRSRNQRAERQVGAPYASDAPSQSMVGSLRSWLEKSRNEPTRPHRWRMLSRPPEPPTAESSHSPPGSRRPNARSSQRWRLPLRQQRVRPPNALAVRPRPQPNRQLPRSDRLAGRARQQPHLHRRSEQSADRASPQPRLRRPSDQSGGPGSPPRRRQPPSGQSAGPATRRPQQLLRRQSARSDGPGRAPSRTPHRHPARSTDAVQWGVRRNPEPNPDRLGQVSTGFG